MEDLIGEVRKPAYHAEGFKRIVTEPSPSTPTGIVDAD